MLLKYCNDGGRYIETVKVDTVWVKEKKDTAYVPQIVNHYLPGQVPPALVKWDTLYIENIELVDTAAILQEFFSFNLYSDTLRNKYGYVLVNDTISRNRILGRGVKTDLLIPEVTKTITITEKPRTELWLGAGMGFGNNINSYELAASIKTKNNHMVGISWEQLSGYNNLFKLNYKRKISFRK